MLYIHNISDFINHDSTITYLITKELCYGEEKPKALKKKKKN